jgi:hypothetical protein
MLLDFYLLSAAFFSQMQSALAASWRRRTFISCRDICQALLARCEGPPDSLVLRVAHGLPFAREFWHGLVGELLLFGCENMPLVQTAPATLCCLLAPERCQGETVRSLFASIEQVHFGSRDLRFSGTFYRPDHAGYNDEDDVARLLRYLKAINPASWHESQLEPMTEFASKQEREEELAFVRDWWPPLVDVYRDAALRGCIIVCERR